LRLSVARTAIQLGRAFKIFFCLRRASFRIVIIKSNFQIGLRQNKQQKAIKQEGPAESNQRADQETSKMLREQ